MVDSKENYKFDVGVKGLNDMIQNKTLVRPFLDEKKIDRFSEASHQQYIDKNYS